MKSESKFFFELWDLVRDTLPIARRPEVAMAMLQAFEDYGIEPRDLADIQDQDPTLERAYLTTFEIEDGDHNDGGSEED